MIRKLTKVLAVSVLGVSMLAACSSNSDSTGTSGSATNLVGITVIDGPNPHVQAFIKGASDVIESNGDTPVVLDPSFDPLKQSQNIDDFVAQNVKGIVVETIDGKAIVSAVRKAKDAGIPVVSADLPFSESDTDLIVSQVMSTNIEGGKMIAEKLAQDLNGQGNIILLYYPGQGSKDREDGMREVFSKYPGINIVGTGDGNGQIDKANQVTQNLMQAHPDIDAVIATNDQAAMGALAAFESAGKLKDVKVYGFDATPEAVKFIQEGKMQGSIRQNPYMLGKQSTEDLYKALAGEEVGEKLKRVPVDLVTIENADKFVTFYAGE